MRHALLLICLALAQGCVAPTAPDVTANHASRFLDATSPPTSSSSTSNVCDNLNNCRSLVSIVTSCLLTIFACVWAAVHPNVSVPEQSWISKQFESLKIIVVTLLVPEWVLAWAMRQFLQARYYAQILENARMKAAPEVEAARLEAMSTPRNDSSEDSTGSVRVATRGEHDEKGTNLLHRKSHEMSAQVPQEPTHEHINSCRCQLTTLPAPSASGEEEADLGRTTEKWTDVHGFIASMGGFHYYRGEKRMFPLQVEGHTANKDPYLLKLVELGLLVPPTWGELMDRSKGDTLAKFITELQTIWFLLRCIARFQVHLAITNLEIMTLGYVMIMVAMKPLWWLKPLNMRCSIRVQDEKFDKYTQPCIEEPRPVEESVEESSFKWSDIIILYVTGNQDRLTALSGEEQVPTFWSGCSTSKLPRHADSELSHHTDSEANAATIPLKANIFGLAATMVFGALHCTAWSYAFPSLAEKLMWRACALAITVIPVPMAVAFLVFDPFRAIGRSDLSAYMHQLCMALCVLLYILARIFLLGLSFSTLRHLPSSAYQSVPWSAFLPHY